MWGGSDGRSSPLSSCVTREAEREAGDGSCRRRERRVVCTVCLGNPALGVGLAAWAGTADFSSVFTYRLLISWLVGNCFFT